VKNISKSSHLASTKNKTGLIKTRNKISASAWKSPQSSLIKKINFDK
jgi:hypothetical protein